MKKVFIILILFVAFSSCKKLEDLNKSTKSPITATGESLFPEAEKNLVDQMITTNVNRNIFRLIDQYWTETTYPDESNYNLVNRSIPDGHWNRLYVSVLKNLDAAKKFITSSTALDPNKANKLAIVDVLSVYTWSVLVETFGNIPYSQALDVNNLSPKYDDGLTVYKDLINRLNQDISVMDPSLAGFESADNIYGSNSEGDVTCWIKFANSLKLRMGIVLADADPSFSKTTVESAAADLTALIQDNSENAELIYQNAAPNDNPMYEDQPASYRHDFVAAKTIVDTMNNWNDPRRSSYFYGKIDTSSVDTITKLAYVGAPIGLKNNYYSYTRSSKSLWQPTSPGIIFDYAEVEFLLAEAISRGYTVGGGSAQLHYVNGIAASFQYWRNDTTGLAAYVAQPQVAFNAAVWKKCIGMQLWIAYYNRGFEGWTAQRRLDFPVLVPGVHALTAFPVRFTYPIAEQTLNGDSYNKASTAIGGDAVTTKLFWDLH